MLTASERWLAEQNASRPPDNRLLMGALAVKAVALAARRFPAFNGFYRDNEFDASPTVHVGVAIAIRGGGWRRNVEPVLRVGQIVAALGQPQKIVLLCLPDPLQNRRIGEEGAGFIAHLTSRWLAAVDLHQWSFLAGRYVAAIQRTREAAVMTLRDKAWSPYAAGILIGLLQVPAFLLIETALGTSSSYVTIGAHIASLADASIGTTDYRAPAAKRSRLSGGGPSASTGCRAAHRWRSPVVSTASSK
jgi:hypothetical protein